MVILGRAIHTQSSELLSPPHPPTQGAIDERGQPTGGGVAALHGQDEGGGERADSARATVAGGKEN